MRGAIYNQCLLFCIDFLTSFAGRSDAFNKATTLPSVVFQWSLYTSPNKNSATNSLVLLGPRSDSFQMPYVLPW